MFKTLACIGLGLVGVNKIIYKTLLKSKPLKTPELLGCGNIKTLAYNDLGNTWVSPLNIETFEILPNFSVWHLQDFQVTSDRSFLRLFRPRAYHENLNAKLLAHDLQVMLTKGLQYDQFLKIATSFKLLQNSKNVIRICLWKEVF